MGNDIRLGIEIGGQGHIHGGIREVIPYPHQQPQIDPITFEARQIANELDHGDAQRAAEHLRRDLQQMPDFRDQRELVEKVDLFDRKGVGADIHLRQGRNGGIWDDISITPPPYYGQGGRPGYPPVGHPIYGRPPEVDLRIDLNLFKGRR